MRDPLRRFTDHALAEPRGLPGPVERLLDVLAVATVAYGLSTLTLAVMGWLTPVSVLATTAALSAGGAALLRRAPRTASTKPTLGAPVYAALAVVVLVTVVNVWQASEHLVIDRDPGAYVTTAIAIADSGDLDLDAPKGPFAERGMTPFVAAFFLSDDGSKVYPQFMHLYPSMLAPAEWVGGIDGVTRAPPIFGGLAMLLFLGVAVRAAGVWAGAIGSIALTTGWLQFHFSRDAYSETAAQLFLFGALWLIFSRPLAWRTAVVAGAALGLVTSARVDAVPIAGGVIAGAAAACAFAFWTRPPADGAGPPTALPYAVLLAAATASAIPGRVDLYQFSPPYYDGQRDRIVLASAVGIALALGGIALLVAARYSASREPRERWRVLARRSAALAAGALVVAGGFQLGVRPLVDEHEEPGRLQQYNDEVRRLQTVEGLEVEDTRTYSEDSLLRVARYFGWPLVIAGLLGLGLFAYRGIASGDGPALALLAAALPLAAVYLEFSRITPDMPWAMRRFIVVAIPLLLLAGAAATGRLAAAVPHRLQPAVLVAASVALLGPVALRSAPAASLTTYEPLAGVVERTCGLLGDDGVALVDPRRSTFATAVFYSCGIPTAVDFSVIAPPELEALAADWAARGRRLHIISAEPGYPTVDMGAASPPVQILAGGYSGVSRSLEGIPEPEVPLQPFEMWVVTPNFR